MREARIGCFKGRYDFLSNFYPVSVEFEGLRYGSAEAAFQAQKTLDTEVRAAFTRLCPAQAKRAGRTLALRPDWEEVKLEIMRRVVEAKFSQHPPLAARLKATGDAPIFEGNARGDRFWGVDCVSGAGENHLGRILMRTRERLKERARLLRLNQKPARETDWATGPMAAEPDRFSGLNVRLTPDGYALLCRGLVPRGMEDKWFVWAREDRLYCHLSWTGECVYIVRAEAAPGGVLCDRVVSGMHAGEGPATPEEIERNRKMDRRVLRALIYALAGEDKKARDSVRALHAMYRFPYRYGQCGPLLRVTLGVGVEALL